ncbi:MAG: hypothetical protein ACU0CA_11235 [Paracoccaceae bacterium]
MEDESDPLADLKQKRDELKLHLHLASKDAEDKWEEMTGEWDNFLTRAQFEKSSEEIAEAAKEMGLKMKAAFDRMKDASK